MIEIEKELDASSLKLRELEVVHDRQETELVTKEQVISDLTENYLRFKYNKSGLRRIIEDKDRLLGSKEAELIAQRDRHTKTVEDLLERIREKTS